MVMAVIAVTMPSSSISLNRMCVSRFSDWWGGSSWLWEQSWCWWTALFYILSKTVKIGKGKIWRSKKWIIAFYIQCTIATIKEIIVKLLKHQDQQQEQLRDGLTYQKFPKYRQYLDGRGVWPLPGFFWRICPHALRVVKGDHYLPFWLCTTLIPWKVLFCFLALMSGEGG